MENQYDAQADQYGFNAEQARKNAKRIAREAGENLELFGEQAQRTLGQGVYLLARSGSLGWESGSRMASGVDVGSRESVDLKEIREHIEAIEDYEELEDKRDTIVDEIQEEGAWRSNPFVAVWYLLTGQLDERYEPLRELYDRRDELNERLSDIEEEYDVDRDVEDLQKYLDSLKDLADEEAGTPELSDAARSASGSDLLAMSRTRDVMERTRRRYLRNIQQTVFNLYENADMYDKQALAAEEAAELERMNQIFGTILGGAETMFGLATGNPAMVFHGFSNIGRSVF